MSRRCVTSAPLRRVLLVSILAGCVVPASAEERKFAVLLAVPRKDMPSYPNVTLPNPNVFHEHFFNIQNPAVDSFAKYWHEISYGNVIVSGNVYGWVEVPWPVLPPSYSGGSVVDQSIGYTDLGGALGGESFDETRQRYSGQPGLVDGWWTPGERFLDLNGNRVFDEGEPFEDFLRIYNGTSWVRLPTGEDTWGRAYIEANYPGDVEGLIARTGNDQYDGPDAWSERGNTKLIRRGWAYEQTPEPLWYEEWWIAYWNAMHEAAEVVPPETVPERPEWPMEIPNMREFVPPPAAIDADGRRPFEPTHNAEYDEEEAEGALIFPDADGYYDGPAEYSDLPSSVYHARGDASGLSGGGDGRFGEVTSPRGDDIYGEDLDGPLPGMTDAVISAAGPLAFNVHGSNGYDAGNVANLEYITWMTAGPETVDDNGRRLEILKRDYNLDGLLDQGSCRDAGTENYAYDEAPTGGNDGNPVTEAYPFNRQRLMEDVIEALDYSVDWNHVITQVEDQRYVFGTVILPEGVCPPGVAVGGRSLFVLPAPEMDFVIPTPDLPEGEDLIFADFIKPLEGSDVLFDLKSTLSHEYLHVWEGYPDLYDYDEYDEGYVNRPVGAWDIMSDGWGHPGPILKERGGEGFCPHAPWLEITDLTSVLRPFEPTRIALKDYAFNPTHSAYFLENPEFPGERFYFWRLTSVSPPDPYRVNFSRYLPGAGMMIMHTDLDSNPHGMPPQNRLGSHFTYNIVQADGLHQLEHGENEGDAGDPWPGTSNAREWNKDTSPQARWWTGIPIPLSILDIQEEAEYSMVTFLWQPRFVPELRFIRPPGGTIVNNHFILKYEASDLFGGTTIDFYVDSDDSGYDGVLLSPSVSKTIAGPVSQEFLVPLSELPAGGNLYFYAHLIPGAGVDGREEPLCSVPQAAANNRGHGQVVDAEGQPGGVTVDVDHSKLENWTLLCIDDTLPGGELWEVQGSVSGTLPQFAHSGEVFSDAEAGISFRIDWTGTTGSGLVSNTDDEYILEDSTAQFVASEFKAFDLVRIVSGPAPGVYRIASVLGHTRLRLAEDPGSGEVSYRLHSFKAEDEFGPCDRFTFMTTGKTSYSKPIQISWGQIVREIYPVIRYVFADNDDNPLHRSPATVIFDASESRDELGNENPNLTYLWDFGDGTTSTQRVVEHTYTMPFPEGVTVTLTVTNPDPFDDPADPEPPPPFLSGTAEVELVIRPTSDTLRMFFESDPVIVPEGGTANLNVRLSEEPPWDVIVTAEVDSGDGNIIVVPPGTARFTPENWAEWQPIMLFAPPDDDASDSQVIIRCSAPGLLDQLITVIEQDKDTQAIITTTDRIEIPEGSSRVFGVRLGARPDGWTTVDIEVLPGTSHISLATASQLVFTSDNWNVLQDVQLAAAEDEDAADRTALVRLTCSGGEPVLVTAVELDNDTQAIVLDRSTASVVEGQNTDIRVRLAAQPEPDEPVVVSVAHHSGDPDIVLLSGADLTFTDLNWNSYQTVTFRALKDADAVNGMAVFRFSAQDLAPVTASLVEVDNDVLAIAVLNSPVTVPEGGTAELRMVLTAQPLVPVDVYVARVSGDWDINVQPPGRVTFTPTNWNVPRAVVLTAAEDVDAADGTTILKCTADGLADQLATAIEQDNDTLAILSDVPHVVVPEGDNVPVRLKLSAAPEGNLTVTTKRISGDTDLFVHSGANLTFSPSNWNVYQSLSIAASPDANQVNGEAVFASSAPGAVPCQFTAQGLDGTVMAIVAEPARLMVYEGESAHFEVRLSAQPQADVWITITRVEGDPDLTVSPTSLKFTEEDWEEAQRVTVYAAQDADEENGTAVFQCAAPGTTPVLVTVTEQDNDVQQILFDPLTVGVPEGEEAYLNLKLARQPSADIIVNVSMGDGDPDIQLATSALVFTPDNWNVWQRVTITAAADPDTANGSNTVICQAAGLPVVSVPVVEQDSDVQMILAPSELTVPEEGTATLSVSLQAQPLEDVGVSLEIISGDPDISLVTAGPLVFTSSNWDVDQPVTVAAAKDDDKSNGTAVLRLSAPGLDDRTVMLIEEDNDPNTPPVALDSTVTVAHNAAQVIQLVAEDPDGFPEPLSYAILTLPAHGTISGLDGASGALVYTPNAGFAGADAFTFRVNDGMLDSGVGTVSITVQAAPAPADVSSGQTRPDNQKNELSDPESTVGAPPMCGAGVVPAVPFLFFGLFWSRLGRYRREQG